jgi:hypothetical protein
VTAATDPPGHGDPRRYRRGCHCRRCTDAIARQAKARILAHHNGTWTDPFTDAGPSRARLLAWREAGYGWREIAAATGIGEDQVRQIAVGKPSRSAPNRISLDLAARVLDGRLPAARRPPAALLDATGTRRRLQALAVAGWHLRLLQSATGVSRSELGAVRRGDLPTVRAATHEAVRRAYERLSGSTPGDHGRQSKDVVATANRARRAGWVAAGRWGEDIDDPDATPDEPDSYSPQRSYEDIAEDALFVLATAGPMDRAAVACRLGVQVRTLDRAFASIREHSAA